MATPKRGQRLEVRLSDVEQAALEKLANLDEVTISDVVRALIREETKRRGLPWPPSP